MNPDFLSKIVARKREAIEKLRAVTNENDLATQALDARTSSPNLRLCKALEAESPIIKVIAEFKCRSPSRGLIRVDRSAVDAATSYQRGGACGISVVTEEAYFGGSIEDLAAIHARTSLPILRKDFLIDPIQIYEAAISGADAILLIAAILDDFHLTKMRAIAEEELGIDALIEIHSSEELIRAQRAGAKLIGFNNRDLRTFEVSLSKSESLIAQAPANLLIISESGLQTTEQLHHLRALGFHGFLIGEALMQSDDPAAFLRDLIGG